MKRRPRVGIDLSPIGFRHRAPGTAVHVENQARALLSMDLEWDWIVTATSRAISDTPFFKRYNPIVVGDAPLSVHVCFRVGYLWQKAGCALGLATAFFAPLFGPPAVTNWFDANAQHTTHEWKRRRMPLKSRILDPLVSLSKRRSRALFILSEYGRSCMIKEEPASAAKWVVTPCGCPPVATRPSQLPTWSTQVEKSGFILYVADFSENKNQRRLIQAWDRLRRQHAQFPALVLIGPAPGDYLQDVIKPVVEQTLHPNEVIIPGYVSDEVVAWAYRSARALVQPSFAEGFGMPLIEAMSSGLPVASSNSTSLPEVAGDAAIFFDPADISSMAAAIQTVVFDELQRERLIRSGFERARHFTWENHAAIVATRIRHELELLRA